MSVMADPAFNILFSFAYYSARPVSYQLAAIFGSDRAKWPKVVLDSGAVTMSNLGKKMNVPKFVAWANQAWEEGCADWVINLDVIGEWEASHRNLSMLQRMGLHHVVPVFHGGSPIREFERLCDAHERVAIGGMVRKGQPYNSALPFLAAVHRIAANTDTKLHGLGMTRQKNIIEFPWNSVDSSTWSGSHRFGKMQLWDGTYLHTRHWSEARKYGPLVTAHGGDPDAIVERYHYKRVAAVTGVAWVKMERALQASRPGFRLHLVDSNNRTMYFLRKALDRLEL